MKLTRCLFAAAPLAAVVLVAACTGGGKTKSGPAEVHDDVYVTGAGNNRILVQGDTAYIVNSLDNTVDKVDLTTCTATAHSCQRTGQVVLPTNSNPYDVIQFHGFLYVTGLLSNVVYRIDPSSMTIVSTIGSNGVMRFSTPESFGTDGASLFVSNGNNFGTGPGYISVMTTGAIVSEIQTTRLYPVGFTRLADNTNAVIDGGYVDFSSGAGVATSAGAVDFVDPAGIIRSIPLGLDAPGPQLALSEDGAAFFVGRGTSISVMKIAKDGSGSPQILTLSSGAAGSFVSHVVVDGGTVWALSFVEDRIYAIDATSFMVKPIHLIGGDVPYLSVAPAGAGTVKGPVHAAVWTHGGRQHLLVLLTLADSMTDVVLP